MPPIARLAALAGLIFALAAGAARAQQEFPPPQGKGRIVVALAGASGPEHYERVSREIAKLGYDVVLFDSNPMKGTNGEAVRQAILAAQQAPHGLPGKVAVVGFSLGGGMSLFYATQWPDLVTGVVAWYPATVMIQNIPGWAGRTKVPVLMFAGEADTYKDCCLIGKAHAVADAAASAGLDFQLVTYPDTQHDFVIDGAWYNPSSYQDAFARTDAKLKQYLGG